MQSAFPPLNALRAFEMAARHENFAKAADALGVTPSAVGHQVRALEGFLGVRLFDRRNRSLRLTTTGARFAAELQRGFGQIALAVDAIRREQESPTLTVSATPALALRWLAPKLEDFRRANPRVELRLDASSSEADLATGQADLDIRYGASVDSALHAEVLFQESVFPVCRAALLKGRPLPLDPATLAAKELLQVDDWAARGGVWRCWEDWFAAAGRDGAVTLGGPRYGEMDLAVEAAAAGHGFAFAAERHLQEERYKQELVRPFPDALAVTYAAYLVCLPEIAELRHIRRFRRWILNLAESGSPQVIHRGAF